MIKTNGSFPSLEAYLPDTAMGAVDYSCVFIQIGTLTQFLHTATPKIGNTKALQWSTSEINVGTLTDDALAKILEAYPDGYANAAPPLNW